VIVLATAKKRDTVAVLSAKLQRAPVAILANYRGLTVAEINALRRQLRPMGAELQVTKNTLVRLAGQKAGLPPFETRLLTGPTAIAFCYQDFVAPAKALTDLARGSKVFSIKGGLLEGRFLSVAEVAELGSLPPKPVLIAQVIAGIQAPLASLLGVLLAPMRNLLYVLDERARQLAATGQ
jgi:large subunit ribosomal protein L10